MVYFWSHDDIEFDIINSRVFDVMCSLFNLNTFVIAFIFGVVFFFFCSFFNIRIFLYSYVTRCQELCYVIVVSISHKSIRPIVATTTCKKT